MILFAPDITECMEYNAYTRFTHYFGTDTWIPVCWKTHASRSVKLVPFP